MTERAYCVAGHTFHFDIDDTCDITDHLDRYAPFASVRDPSPVFRLYVTDSPVPLSTDRTGEMVCSADLPGVMCRMEDGGGLTVSIALAVGKEPAGELSIAANLRSGRLKLTSTSTDARLFAFNSSAMIMYALSTAGSGTLLLHASVVMNRGYGYIFLGRSGAGKSTHSRLWLEHISGSSLVNDDNPILKLFANGTVRVYGSPWSGKTNCYRNISVLAGAFVSIRQSGQNEISRQNGIQAFASLCSSVSGLAVLPEISENIYDSAASVVSSMPFFSLDCRPDEEAARVCASGVMTQHTFNAAGKCGKWSNAL